MVSSMSQIRTYGGGPTRDSKDPRVEEYNSSLRAGLKQYQKEKTPELKAKLSSQWRMASQQGVNIDSKLSEQVKKVVSTSDLGAPSTGSSGGGSGPCGSQPCGSGPCSAAPEEVSSSLMGGLAKNFGPAG